MTIDVSLQACGTDHRELGTTVHLPPEVQEVRYNPAGSTRVQETQGDRRKLARTLREAGYTVVWDDVNPAVALASRTSPARAAASRANGALSPGREVVKALLCPAPLWRTLRRLDKGTMADMLFLLTGGAGEAGEVLQQVRGMRERLAAVAAEEEALTP